MPAEVNVCDTDIFFTLKPLYTELDECWNHTDK